MRGDGPGRAGRAGPYQVFPHARGWTGPHQHPDRGCRVPRMRGMDRWPVSRLRPWLRVPRMRGDGPPGLAKAKPRARCSRMRGMDRHGHAQPAPGQVFPACGGWTVPVSPASLCQVFPACAGWTAPRLAFPWYALVFPACAGMDRGAEPSQNMRQCSPHARGWTVLATIAALPPDVFPACAGMDRLTVFDKLIVICVSPHARGWTGPGIREFRRSLVFPACAGWTAFEYGNRRAVVVFPACAGMDRGLCSNCRKSKVFPACAGMDRPPNWPRSRTRSVPRMRGDGPPRPARAPDAQLCSPHARGWTGRVVRPEHREGVFPACAGMDRI